MQGRRTRAAPRSPFGCIATMHTGFW
jgi:hypothetical protein